MSRDRLTVTIVHGATATEPRPDDADTLVQVEAVAEALSARGHRVRVLGLGEDLTALAALTGSGTDLVFNLVESLGGSDRLAPRVPAALERLGVPFTGCGARAMAQTSDKLIAKGMMRAAGLPTPDWLEVGGGQAADPCALYIVKSVTEHASFGLDAGSIVSGREAAASIAARARSLGGAWFAERFVAGREFNLSLLDGPAGVEVLAVPEMLFVDFPEGAPHIVDYAAKWDAASHAYHHTPRRFDLPAEDAALVEVLRGLALRAWDLFGLCGYARVDFRVDDGGRPFILEVNANPCLAPDAGFVAAAAHVGYDFSTVIARVLAAARTAPAAATARTGR